MAQEIMNEHIIPITNSSHLNLQKGAIVVFNETPSDYLPGVTYGRLLEAVFGGAPDVYFPIWPNRSRLGFMTPDDTMPLSACIFETRNEEGVEYPEHPFAIGKWSAELRNAQGGKILHLFIKQNDLYTIFTITQEDAQWKIYAPTQTINTNDLAHCDPELQKALITL